MISGQAKSVGVAFLNLLRKEKLSSSQKKDPVFESMLAFLQAATSGNLSGLAPRRIENSNSKNAELKIQDIVEISSQAKASQNQNIRQNPAQKADTNNPSEPKETLFPKIKFMQNITLLFNNQAAAGIVALPAMSNLTQPTLADEINFLVEEIVSKIKVIKTDNLARLDLTLKRGALGEVKISLTLEKGKLNIELVLNQEARDLLEPYFSDFLDKLKEAGINVGNLNVSLKGNYSPSTDQEKSPEASVEKVEAPKQPRIAASEPKNLSENKFLKVWAASWNKNLRTALVKTWA